MMREFPQSWRRKRLLVWEHLRMQPQDDPEARIRDLERPLADVARTSELGTDHYSGGGAYPPPLPPTYGAPYPPPPYPGAPQRAKSGLGAGWWLFASIVVVFLIVGAGVAIYSANVFSLGTETRPPVEIPNVAGGGGQFDKPPTAEPSVPGGGPVVETPSAEPAIPPPGEQVSISGVGKNETIACDERNVSVSGFNNVVTITGHCASLTVSGKDNQVTVDSSAIIAASGFDNVVTFHTGTPEIGVGGFNNIVEQG
jgi:hypothetical protein